MGDSIGDDLKDDRLHFAAMEGDIAAMEKILAAGDPIDRFDMLGNTPLHYAAEQGHLEAVRFLLDRGANVNAINPDVCGDSPLGAIAANCSLAMAQLLVKAGADPRLPGNMSLTAIQKAKERKRGDGPAVYKLLCEARPRR
jgi:ankyrin repeat protein